MTPNATPAPAATITRFRWAASARGSGLCRSARFEGSRSRFAGAEIGPGRGRRRAARRAVADGAELAERGVHLAREDAGVGGALRRARA